MYKADRVKRVYETSRCLSRSSRVGEAERKEDRGRVVCMCKKKKGRLQERQTGLDRLCLEGFRSWSEQMVV